jgi:hypothetical protein
MKLAIAFILLVLGAVAQAQPQPPHVTRQEDQAYLREQRDWNSDDRRPHWCRHYDRWDYRKDLRMCSTDSECRYRIKRKAERCGLRG